MSLKAMPLLALLLTACAHPPPQPLSAGLARITLDSGSRADMRAYRLDGNLVRQLRFPDISPGRHELQVRYQFEVPGGTGRSDRLSEPRRRTCILGLQWEFVAGKHYRVTAYRLGWNPLGWLENDTGGRLVRARVIRCGPGV